MHAAHSLTYQRKATGFSRGAIHAIVLSHGEAYEKRK
jgi:hypothetical protein